jgi:hypothetical protein
LPRTRKTQATQAFEEVPAMPQAELQTFQDGAAIRERRVDFDDPLECAAIAAHRMTFATPEDVGGMLTGPHGRDELACTWLRLEAHERHLWRRRAAIILAGYRQLDAG